MKKRIQINFVSMILAVTFLLSFSVPAFAVKPSAPQPQDSGYKQVEPAGTLLVNGYDVVAVKQSNFLVIWTRTPADETTIKDQIFNSDVQLGLGTTTPADVVFFSGYDTHCTNPNDWKQFGDYYVTKAEDGNEYFHATGISHFIVGTGVIDDGEPQSPELGAIQVTKEISGDTPSAMPTFEFTLSDTESDDVYTASQTGAGTAAFDMTGFVLPTGDETKTLVMAETNPDPIPENWDYSNESYLVLVSSDGLVTYENSDETPLGEGVLPTFTNTYTAPEVPGNPVLGTIQATKIISGSPSTMPTFAFTLSDTESNAVYTATQTGAGTTAFDMTGFVLPVGDSARTLIMRETHPDPVPENWAYSNESYLVIVHSDGSVIYEASNETPLGEGVLPTFTNTYTAPEVPENPVLGTIQATKIISGSPSTMPTFAFTLSDTESNAVYTATQTGVGTAAFDMTGFVLPVGDSARTLIMRETHPDPVPENWAYSNESYLVNVHSDGSVTYANSNETPLGEGVLPTFTNTYTTPVVPGNPELGTIQATKIISGSPSTMPTFTFTLNDSGTIYTATKAGAGTAAFDMTGFVLPVGDSTKTLIMRETHPDPVPENWAYSNESYLVIVHSDGSVSYEGSNEVPLGEGVLPTFINTYTAPIVPVNPVLGTIQATKIISGSPSTMPTFKFTLNDSGTIYTAAKAGAGTAAFDMTGFVLPTGEATKTLTMTETHPDPVPENWAYSNESYLVIVHSDGSVSYEASNETPLGEGVLPTFTNTYTAPDANGGDGGGGGSTHHSGGGGTPSNVEPVTTPAVPETVPEDTIPLASPAVPEKKPQETIPNDPTPLASPKTGDSSNPLLLVVLLGLGGISFVASKVLKIRSSK